MAKGHKTVEYRRYGYLFIAPFFIVYLLFQLWPLLYTFGLSTQDMYERFGQEVQNGFAGGNGLGNFSEVLGIAEGSRAYALEYLGNTAIMWLLNFIPQILLSLLLAVWLTDTKVKLKGSGTFKIMVYLPNIITAASISILFYSLFGQNGPVTKTLLDWGLIAKDKFFLESAWATRGVISFIQFWMWYGNTTLLLIAGVLGINPSLFEAADIDGCNGTQKFFKITLPMLKPILLYVLVTSAIGGLQMFDIPSLYNVSQSGEGLPDGASTTVTMYIRNLTSAGNMGKAAAVSVILFIITLVISLLFFYFMGDREKKPKQAKKGVVK